MSKTYLLTAIASVLTMLTGNLAIAQNTSSAVKDPIIHISPDANVRNVAVWAVTAGGRLLWCRSTSGDTECIVHQPLNTDKSPYFIELAERIGDGGSSVWALTKQGQLYWCRPEGMESIGCYP
ncbi:MAG: hypothetical protein V7739_07065 [Motiliproteus sp.]